MDDCFSSDFDGVLGKKPMRNFIVSRGGGVSGLSFPNDMRLTLHQIL